ncbi:MAG: 2-amino-4-hydroxy-6-hydroxymethyldihydropteridine diphosphokinase [Candidatus Omnitrophica bacterium]|nr:2-amino-4-hydroxy-6-hydroxymethyldihydropteridine diphosphokinase [Candidatus Omnitrophota bacterium]MBU1922875.1 2-amino-4-hydroxy-6-hydroxymethyldihydropteridine diphosphokinase [Candidatus Omnitrophota bacterium]
MMICYLGIGSNLGNRKKNIKLATKKINALENTRVLKKSKVMESLPVGGPGGQHNFLNTALKIDTKLSALILLKKLKEIENQLGRKKTVRFGPRVIDLDILLYADQVKSSKALNIPHPRMFVRDFVIKPLMEVL